MIQAGRIRTLLYAASRHLWILLFPLSLPALAPFYTEGLTRSFDGGLHLLRIGLLDRYVHSGVFYPRWAPELLLGHGYPLFSFYAPAAYYFAEAFVLLGLSPYHAFISAMAAFILSAGIGMYALALSVFGRRQHLAALVAAVAYLYGPYLLTNVYIRGAIAETGAQALLPWILLTARGLYRGDRPQRSAFALALLLGLLAVTHTITLLTLPPFLLLYMLLHWLTTGRDRTVLRWSAAALLGAMGVSAFFWLPLIGERRYLADTAYEISRTVWLPGSMWTWDNFLDAGLTYTHTFARPIRLGLVQLLLAVIGLFVARRKDPEWLFLGGSALFLSLLMGQWALPLWLRIEALSIVQFAWRLLALLSLPLALLTGGIVLLPKPASLRIVRASAAIALIVFSQQPRLDWMDVFAPETVDVSAPVFAQTEVEQGALGTGEGNSTLQEFRPRWADQTLTLKPETAKAFPPLDAAVLRAGDFGLSLRTRAAEATALRLAAFYYPGWQARIDNGPLLQPYPSTNLGLLTIDLPPGDHVVDIAWAGTPLQWAASTVSVATLLTLALLAWRCRRRWLAGALSIAAVLALFAWAYPSTMEPVTTPAEDLSAAGVHLLGYHTAQPAAQDLYVYPYWQVQEIPPDGTRFVWTLSNGAGAVVAESHGMPYYNAYSASNWAPNTVVDDAVRIRLPESAPSGTYALSVQLLAGSADTPLASARAGQITIDPPQSLLAPPAAKSDARFGSDIRLLGFDYLQPHAKQEMQDGKPPVVNAGDYVRLALYWQALDPININYHAFVHLVDAAGRPLVQEDQLPGPFFQPPRLWDTRTPWLDIYLLRIPADAASGLYWPSVGMYDFANLDRLPVFSHAETVPRDDLRLPPIKVLGSNASQPSARLDYRFSNFAALTGYGLEPSDGLLQAGASLTVTLQFRALEPTGRDLIRFLQLYNQDAGVVAQHDGPPQQGDNPTWAWVPGETVHDQVSLSIAADAPAGHYTLYAGFYDPAFDNDRVEVHDAGGAPMSDNWAPIATVELAAAGQ